MEKIEKLLNSIDEQEKQDARNDYLRYIRKWPWFVLACAIGLAVSFVVYKMTPESYELNSRLLIYTDDKTLSSELSFEEQYYVEKSNISDQVGVLMSYSNFREAIENLDWKITWYKKGLFGKTELYGNEPFDVITQEGATNLKNIPIEITALNDKEFLVSVDGETKINSVKQRVKFKEKGFFNIPYRNGYFNFSLSNKKGTAGEKYVFVFNDESILTAYFQEKVEFTAMPDVSDIVILTSEGPIPEKVADFLNEVNNVFIRSGMEKKSITSENSVNFIDTQIEEVEETLRAAEEKLNSYRRSNQLVDLGQEANLIYNKIGEIDNEKYRIDQILEYYQNLRASIGNSVTIGQMSTPTIQGAMNEGLNAMVANLKELYSRREMLAISVKEKSPNFIMLETEIQTAKRGIEKTLDNLIETARREKQNINSRYNTVQARLSSLPETEKNLIAMQREFDVNNELYNFLLKKKAEAAISQASIAPQAKVIDPALAEYAERIGPKLILFAFAGIFAGLIIPFLIITFLAFFNNRIQSSREVESASKVPVIEEIIHHKYRDPLPVFNHPHSGITESIKSLKVKLLRAAPDIGRKVISVNSLISGEGKSFISANLAAALSSGNKRVLLVGTDLRNPRLHTYFGVNEENGLSSFLNNEVNFDEITNTTSYTNLFFTQAGYIPENPSELLENNKFEEFINTARSRFDYIVLDNAPMLLVPDANLVGRVADTSLFILRINYSRKNEISDINKIIRDNKLKNAYVVINDALQRGYGHSYKYWKKGYGNYNRKLRIA